MVAVSKALDVKDPVLGGLPLPPAQQSEVKEVKVVAPVVALPSFDWKSNVCLYKTNLFDCYLQSDNEWRVLIQTVRGGTAAFWITIQNTENRISQLV